MLLSIGKRLACEPKKERGTITKIIKMNRVVDLSIDKPIDVAKAIVLLGNQTKIFYQMLGKLEILSLNPSLEALA